MLLLAVLAAPVCPHLCTTLASDAQLDPARSAIAEAYAQAGLCSPCEDAALMRAAQQIAGGSKETLPEPVALQRIVQAAGAGDPSPRAMLVSGRDWKTLARDLDQQWKPQAGDQVIGLGAGSRPGSLRLAILVAERKASVEPLPARVAPGTEIAVKGSLRASLRSPALYVEGPNGMVTQLETTVSGTGFGASFRPEAPGPYSVELLVLGDRGPEVVFLKSVQVGAATPGEPFLDGDRAGRDDSFAVLEEINRERQRYGVPALAPDPRLSRVAQAYARELRELKLFAHVSPRSGDLKARLRRAGYPFRSAAENLAQGPTALEAQALAANSPAHRRAMLDWEYTRCGIGLSRALSGEGKTDVLLVEVFAVDQ